MIFISYASEDQKIASKLYDQIQSRGLNVWMDKKAIQPGQEWETQIWRAASSADFFCLLLSPRSVTKRGFIRKEIRFALDKWKEKLPEDVYLIPCRIENVDPPFELKHLQYIDLNTDSEYAALVELLTTLENKSERQELVAPTEPYNSQSETWETNSLEVDLKYPVFIAHDLQALNELIRETIDRFKQEANEFEVEHFDGEIKSFYVCSFNVFRSSRHIIGVLFLISWYGSGAAHPNRGFLAINFNRLDRRPFLLSEAFANPNDAVQVISNACRFDILKKGSFWLSTG